MRIVFVLAKDVRNVSDAFEELPVNFLKRAYQKAPARAGVETAMRSSPA